MLGRHFCQTCWNTLKFGHRKSVFARLRTSPPSFDPTGRLDKSGGYSGSVRLLVPPKLHQRRRIIIWTSSSKDIPAKTISERQSQKFYQNYGKTRVKMKKKLSLFKPSLISNLLSSHHFILMRPLNTYIKKWNGIPLSGGRIESCRKQKMQVRTVGRNYYLHLFLVRPAGFEPATYGFVVEFLPKCISNYKQKTVTK